MTKAADENAASLGHQQTYPRISVRVEKSWNGLPSGPKTLPYRMKMAQVGRLWTCYPCITRRGRPIHKLSVRSKNNKFLNVRSCVPVISFFSKIEAKSTWLAKAADGCWICNWKGIYLPKRAAFDFILQGNFHVQDSCSPSLCNIGALGCMMPYPEDILCHGVWLVRGRLSVRRCHSFSLAKKNEWFEMSFHAHCRP